MCVDEKGAIKCVILCLWQVALWRMEQNLETFVLNIVLLPTRANVTWSTVFMSCKEVLTLGVLHACWSLHFIIRDT